MPGGWSKEEDHPSAMGREEVACTAGEVMAGTAAEVAMAQLVIEADPLRDESYVQKQTGGSGEDLAAPLGHLALTTL